jgi:hypothetical protein
MPRSPATRGRHVGASRDANVDHNAAASARCMQSSCQIAICWVCAPWKMRFAGIAASHAIRLPYEDDTHRRRRPRRASSQPTVVSMLRTGDYPYQMHRQVSPVIAHRARQHCYSHTSEEQLLWLRIRGCQLGVWFRRQVPIGTFTERLMPALARAFGSSSRTRTWDPAVNSRLLYRLS